MRPYAFLCSAAALALVSCGGGAGPSDGAESVPPMDDAAFEAQLVRVLNERPEIVLEALETFQRRSEQQEVASVLPDLTSARYGHAIGASEEEASLILIEFFDYHCGFCQRAMEDVLALVENDPTIRVVFQELPILREESRTAALTALAAASLDGEGYRRAHQALLTTSGVLDEEAVDRALQRAGFEPAAVEAALAGNEEEFAATLERSLEIARTLRVQGTPYFIAADPETGRYDVLEGYRPEDFAAFIEGARS